MNDRHPRNAHLPEGIRVKPRDGRYEARVSEVVPGDYQQCKDGTWKPRKRSRTLYHGYSLDHAIAARAKR